MSIQVNGNWWHQRQRAGKPVYNSYRRGKLVVHDTKEEAHTAAVALRLIHPEITGVRVSMRYRDNMTPEETARFLDEITALDRAYAEAKAKDDANHANMTPEELEEAAEAEEGTLDYFNRYIAGDRK